MEVPLFGRALRGVVPLAVGMVLLMSGTVQAAATHGTFGEPPTYFTDVLPPDPTVCGMGNDPGVISGTHELRGTFVRNDNVFEFHATETYIVRVDLPASSVYGPGAYLLDTSVAHWSGTQSGAVSTFTNTVSVPQDVIYDGAGNVIGRTTFQLVEHITTSFPSGDVVVSVDRARLTCP